MTDELNQRALQEAIRQATSELTDNWSDVCRMRDLAAINHAKSGNPASFRFSTTAKITQEPMGDRVLVKVGISCSAGLKSEHDNRMIDNQTELDIQIED